MAKIVEAEVDPFGVDEPEETVVERLDPSGLLSDEEVLEARASAKERVMRERRAAAMLAFEAQETERLRREEGLTTGIAQKDEIVNFTVDLAPYCDKISIGGPLGAHYYNGKTYTVPRHVADTLAEIQFRTWRHEDQTEGKDLLQTYKRKFGTSINGVTGASSNSPRLPNA